MTPRDNASLSPICRRAFFRKVGKGALGALAVAAVAGQSACYGDSYTNASYVNTGACGYCNGWARNYYHCDSAYCNYSNAAY